MTKAELIKQLEPFEDDIIITIRDRYDSDLIKSAEAQYYVRLDYAGINDTSRTDDEATLLIE